MVVDNLDEVETVLQLVRRRLGGSIEGEHEILRGQHPVEVDTTDEVLVRSTVLDEREGVGRRLRDVVRRPCLAVEALPERFGDGVGCGHPSRIGELAVGVAAEIAAFVQRRARNPVAVVLRSTGRPPVGVREGEHEGVLLEQRFDVSLTAGQHLLDEPRCGLAAGPLVAVDGAVNQHLLLRREGFAVVDVLGEFDDEYVPWVPAVADVVVLARAFPDRQHPHPVVVYVGEVVESGGHLLVIEEIDAPLGFRKDAEGIVAESPERVRSRREVKRLRRRQVGDSLGLCRRQRRVTRRLQFGRRSRLGDERLHRSQTPHVIERHERRHRVVIWRVVQEVLVFGVERRRRCVGAGLSG